MIRWPAAGRCKKRLARDIGLKSAACIQKRINKHTITVAKTLQAQGFLDIQLAVSGLATKTAKRWGMNHGINNVFEQGEGSLGLRMRRQVLLAQKQQKCNNIGRPTILIGSDLPTLCKLDLIKATEALQKHEIVLGPSIDGGYWLIGLSKKLVKPVASWPFIGMPWGTNQVLEKTINSANLRAISYRLLREQNDIDQLEDLAPWQV